MSKILSIDYGTKTIGLASAINKVPMPIGNLENDGDLRFKLMGIIAQHNIETILIGFPKNELIQEKINQFIKTLQLMFEWEIIKVDENYTSVQAQAITWSTGKHIATDTLSAMELINRYFKK